MAREKVADRRAREEAEEVARFEVAKVGYQKRVIIVMGEFSNLNGFSFKKDKSMEKVHVVAFNFKVSDGYWFGGNEYYIPAEMHSWEHLYALERAEQAIADYYSNLKEERRKHDVRQNALEKLNKEERELLGIVV